MGSFRTHYLHHNSLLGLKYFLISSEDQMEVWRRLDVVVSCLIRSRKKKFCIMKTLRSNECDYLGYDFDNQPSQPVECGGLCAAREECVAFTWSKGICYLKRGPVRSKKSTLKDFSPIAPNCALHATVCGYKGLYGHPLIDKEKMVRKSRNINKDS